MFTPDGEKEFEKYSEWVSDEDFMFSPNFIPTDDTPKEAIEYYKYMMSDVVDFSSPDFKWPTGIGANF